MHSRQAIPSILQAGSNHLRDEVTHLRDEVTSRLRVIVCTIPSIVSAA